MLMNYECQKINYKLVKTCIEMNQAINSTRIFFNKLPIII